MKYNIRKYILSGITVILAAAVLTACGGNKPEKDDTAQSTQEIFAMDTYMSLTAYGSNSEEAVSKAVQEINRLDAMFSVGNEDSDVTKINENGSGEVSEETAFIMNRAMQVSKETKGAFDITIYPVMELWGFTTKNYRQYQVQMRSCSRCLSFQMTEQMTHRCPRCAAHSQTSLAQMSRRQT